MAFVKHENSSVYTTEDNIFNTYATQDSQNDIVFEPTMPTNTSNMVHDASNSYTPSTSSHDFAKNTTGREFSNTQDMYSFPMPIKTEIDDSCQWMQGESEASQNQPHTSANVTDNTQTPPANFNPMNNQLHQGFPINFYERHQALANSFLSSYTQVNNPINNTAVQNYFRPLQDQAAPGFDGKDFNDFNNRRKDFHNHLMRAMYPVPVPYEPIDTTYNKLRNGAQVNLQIPTYEVSVGDENFAKNNDPTQKEDPQKGNTYPKTEFKTEIVNSPEALVHGTNYYSAKGTETRNEPSKAHNGKCEMNHHFQQQGNCSKHDGDGEGSKGKYACEGCHYKCQSAAILKIHERTHSGEKPFGCNFCNYKSGQKNNVAKHVLVHIKEKPYHCQYCEYRCAQKNNLVVHERTHTGEKPFVCTYCEYRTVQKPNLVKHMYLHTNEKPFSCDVCEYRCVQKTNLMKHKQKHSLERPFECGQCDYKSSQKSNLTKHRHLHDRTKPYQCDLCPYKSIQKCNLTKHQFTKHGVSSSNNSSGDSSSSVSNVSVNVPPVAVVNHNISNHATNNHSTYDAQDTTGVIQLGNPTEQHSDNGLKDRYPNSLNVCNNTS